MQEIKNVKIIKYKKIFNLKRFLNKAKVLFKLWIIVSIIVAIATVGYSSFKMIFTGEVSAIINFSFDGIESGMDPKGNKFDVSEIKSIEIVEESIEELEYENIDPELIQKNLSIESVVPDNVIDNIIAYSPLIENDKLSANKNIQDTSYYSTQYEITLECESAGITKKEAANILNKITEKYNNFFYKTYGYSTALESSLKSVNYKDYDYIDAINVFEVSLRSLQKYIDELEKKDTNRFKSKDGYTFADISASIDTVCTENLEQTMAYLLQYNVSKDKKILISKYEYNIEDLNRKKQSSEEMIAAINNTLNEYEKSSILVMGNAGNAPGTSVNKTSDAYNYLIEQKLSAQSVYSSSEQQIKLYNDRIKSLESSIGVEVKEENVETQFEKINDKINMLLDITNSVVTEYYEKDLLSNAYTVLTPANPSTVVMIKNAVIDSKGNIFSIELIVFSAYLGASVILCFIKKKNKQKNQKQKTKNKKSVQ